MVRQYLMNKEGEADWRMAREAFSSSSRTWNDRKNSQHVIRPIPQEFETLEEGTRSMPSYIWQLPLVAAAFKLHVENRGEQAVAVDRSSEGTMLPSRVLGFTHRRRACRRRLIEIFSNQKEEKDYGTQFIRKCYIRNLSFENNTDMKFWVGARSLSSKKWT
ncbi:hypothetical protein NA56DRAFT_687556 [Hyaloscypha hepaticicola]|uniref:Uncharacterized protein n=1 Tax=Hyaloscypha hepaticicola TaxID=2082293 RepID=A0A2J6QAE0_9HELO|nr:hypothetical protein NA56DRAFT_687556 [Hyaloscypha hepaticicola]